MKHSESIKNISNALVKAQRNIGAASKDAKNPFFKSKYADLGAVMEACKDALNEQGISVLQPVSSDAIQHSVETILLHESGEFISDTMRLELSKGDMQALGSAISYARRYALQSMMFIPAEDCDAESTMDRPKPVPKPAPAIVNTPAAPSTPTAPVTSVTPAATPTTSAVPTSTGRFARRT